MHLSRDHYHCLYGSYLILFVSCLCVSINAQPIGDSATPEFTVSQTIVSDSGHTRLAWSIPQELLLTQTPEFELQQSNASDFSNFIVCYKGPDTASFISGLPNGMYHFRVRSHFSDDQISGWSKPIVVQVKHHSLQLAYFLFAIGFFVFAATVYVIVSGTRNPNTLE